MKFSRDNADIFTPDGADPVEALRRTTHLSIGAHPDDNEIMAYPGIAECYLHPEKSFTGVTVTDGAGSARVGPFARFTDEELVKVRREEQRYAAMIGRFGLQLQLGHSSSDVKKNARDAVRSDLRKILEGCRPQVLYTHNPFDKHDTHIAVFTRTLEALRELPKNARPKRWLGMEVWRDLDWVLDNEKVNLPADKYESLAVTLIGVFDSQVTGGKRYDLAGIGRRRANATYGDSHSADAVTQACLAVDLTPLLEDDSLTLEAYATGYLDRFRDDVLGRLSRFA